MSAENLPEWCRITSQGRLHVSSPRRVSNTYCGRPGCENHDLREDPKYRRCSKCKAVTYCSEECQKQDWPSHKVTCGIEPGIAAFQKVHKRLATNPFLHPVFQMLIIYKHGLHLMSEDALNSFRSKPFGLALVTQFEPADIRDFLNRFSLNSMQELLEDQDANDTEKAVVAIPQIVAASAISDQKLSQDEKGKWKHQHAVCHEKGLGNGKLPLVAVLRVFQFFGGQNTPFHCGQNVTLFLSITDNWITLAKDRMSGSDIIPRPTGDLTKDIANIVQSANELIRSDVKNDLRLRIKLTKLDKQLMALASIPSREKVVECLAFRSAAYGQILGALAGMGVPQEGRYAAMMNDYEEFVRDSQSPGLAWIDYLRAKVMRERTYALTARQYGCDSDSILQGLVDGTGCTDLQPEVPEIALDMSEFALNCQDQALGV